MRKILSSVLCLALLLSLGCFAFAEEAVGTGTAQGRNGPVTVEVTFDGDIITSIDILESSETVGVSDAAQGIIPAQMVEYQTTAVDTVAGATLTSAALRLAVQAAIEDAGKDKSNYSEKVPAHVPETLEDMDCDIVVVGGGIAGLMAAVTARVEGTENVILLEKHAQVGGSAALSSAFMVTAEYDRFEAENPDYDDSLGKVMDGLRATAELGDPKYEVNWEYLEFIERCMPETLDFMFDLGLTASFRTLSTAVTAWDGQGAGLMANLDRIARNQGITVLTNTTGTELLTENGAVVGVKAVFNGDDLTVHAKKVILATGGSSFAKDAAFENRPAESKAIFFQGASTGDTGDGQAMAAAVGAEVGGLLRLKQAGIDYNLTLRNALAKRPSTDTAIIVNADGERFTSEKQPSNQMLTDIFLAEGSPKYFAIIDTADEELAAAMKEAYENGLAIFYGETVADLAEAIKVDPSALQATVDRYQKLCEKGEDEDFGKPAASLVAFTGADGYYAINVYAAGWGTMGGGIRTDEAGHVLDTDGNVISNLFATGEVADHDIFGQYYVGGMSMSTFAAAGHNTGRAAARELMD